MHARIYKPLALMLAINNDFDVCMSTPIPLIDSDSAGLSG